MFYGDGMITPAISVLGAVEGLEIIAPHAAPLHRARDAGDHRAAVRASRSAGTASVGRLFGPVMCVWFVVIGGARRRTQIVQNPACWRRSSPRYAIAFVLANPMLAFLALGAVVLAVTGTEALYADMGHFGAHADPPRVAVLRACRRWCSTISGRARCCSTIAARSRTRSTCWRRNGR